VDATAVELFTVCWQGDKFCEAEPWNNMVAAQGAPEGCPPPEAKQSIAKSVLWLLVLGINLN
jgi:hypothetical protein